MSPILVDTGIKTQYHQNPSGAGAGGGLRMPGTAGNYISTPDSVLNSITGDIDIRVYCSAATWATGTDRTILAKLNTTGNQRSYRFYIDASNNIIVSISHDGVTSYSKSSFAIGSVPVADGGAHWFRTTYQVNNGSNQNVCRIYTSADGITWTLRSVGTDIGTTGPLPIFDSTALLELGSHTGGTGALWNGTVYYAEVRNGIDGPIAARFDSSQVQVSGSQLPASINGWTWNGTALYKRDDYVRLPGTAGNYLSFPDTVANSVTGDIDVRAKISLDDWTPTGVQTLIAKQSVGDPQRCYFWRVVAAGNLEFGWYPAGTGASLISKTSTAIIGATDGSVLWLRSTLAVATGQVMHYTSPDGVTWTQLGTTNTTAGATSMIDSTDPITIGARSGGSVENLAGNVYYAEVRNGINGPVVASWDGRVVQTPWTINGAGWNWEGSSFTGKPGIALQLPGISGSANFLVTTPDTVANSIVGDIDIRAKINVASLAAPVAILAKESGLGRSYRFVVLASGAISLVWSVDGTTVYASLSGTVGRVVAGVTIWVRATLDVDNGAAGYTCSFYTSTDGAVWTPAGSTTTGPVTSIADTTAVIEIGSRFGNSSDPFNGIIYNAEVRNGIDGPIVAMFDPARMAKTGTRTPASTVQPGGTPNMLTPNQASIETDATGWAAATNAPTLAQDATQFLDGTKSLSITATAVGPANMEATTPGANKFPLVGGKEYLVKASFRAAVTPRSCQVKLWWYDNTNTFISAGNSGTVTDSTSAWTEVSSAGLVSFKAPANAVAGVVVLTVQNAVVGEVHYVDRVSLVEAAAVWTINGSAWDLVAA